MASIEPTEVSSNNLSGNHPTFSPGRIRVILCVIFSLFPLVGMGIDLIAPSLPAISHQLNVTSNFAKNLISFYLFGYAFGNLLIGFLSDAFGRRNLMLVGFFLFILASLLPTFNPNLLTFARLLQGFAIAAFAVIGRAVLSDIISKEKLIRYATIMTTMWGIGPIIGPVIGGYLQFYFNWIACFYFFAMMGLLGFFAIFFLLPETLPSPQAFQLKQIKNNFSTIISHKIFIGIVLLMGIEYSLIIVFNTQGPFLIQTSLGHSSVYFGHIALFMGLFFLLSTFLCRYLLKKLPPERILRNAIQFFILVAIFSCFFSLIEKENIWIITVPSLFMFISAGIIYPVAMGKALFLFRHIAGSASAIMNFINVFITGFVAWVMSFLTVESAIPMNFIYLGLLILASVVYSTLVKEELTS